MKTKLLIVWIGFSKSLWCGITLIDICPSTCLDLYECTKSNEWKYLKKWRITIFSWGRKLCIFQGSSFCLLLFIIVLLHLNIIIPQELRAGYYLKIWDRTLFISLLQMCFSCLENDKNRPNTLNKQFNEYSHTDNEYRHTDRDVHHKTCDCHNTLGKMIEGK